jgi:hypothetical protein
MDDDHHSEAPQLAASSLFRRKNLANDFLAKPLARTPPSSTQKQPKLRFQFFLINNRGMVMRSSIKGNSSATIDDWGPPLLNPYLQSLKYIRNSCGIDRYPGIYHHKHCDPAVVLVPRPYRHGSRGGLDGFP